MLNAFVTLWVDLLIIVTLPYGCISFQDRVKQGVCHASIRFPLLTAQIKKTGHVVWITVFFEQSS